MIASFYSYMQGPHQKLTISSFLVTSPVEIRSVSLYLWHSPHNTMSLMSCMQRSAFSMQLQQSSSLRPFLLRKQPFSSSCFPNSREVLIYPSTKLLNFLIFNGHKSMLLKKRGVDEIWRGFLMSVQKFSLLAESQGFRQINLYKPQFLILRQVHPKYATHSCILIMMYESSPICILKHCSQSIKHIQKRIVNPPKKMNPTMKWVPRLDCNQEHSWKKCSSMRDSPSFHKHYHILPASCPRKICRKEHLF